ncbi:MAG: YceI family protein [Anaerolineae bacterium]|nr:YceI family protein [Anaerolineae bacterium]NUQ04900.1 YceI family protein [Anaerolineae bacterium]
MARFEGNYNSVSPARKLMPIIVGVFLAGMLIGAVIGGVGGVFVFIRVTGSNDQPSAPISAPTLSLDSLTIVPTTAAVVSTVQPTTAPTTASVVPSATHDMAAMSSVAMPTAVPVVLARQLFRISTSESVVRFAVDETIPPQTAVGTTNQIAGDFIIDFANPANSQLGVIRINLRTLRTDDPDRDNSIRCCVLLTAQDAYEFTEFVPTSVTGLPTQVSLGQTVDLQVTGNLSLRGVTRPVTFTVRMTLGSAEEIRGEATAFVNRSDFGILDDDMLAYHGVAEQVRLEFDFVARAVAS